MAIQDFLKTLKTAKRPWPLHPSSTPISSLNNGAKETPFNSSSSDFLSCLSSHKLNSFLSDPNVRTSDCFVAFSFLLRNQSDLSFKPDLHAHLTLVCRLIKSQNYADAAILLTNLSFHQNYRYPFPDFVSWVENYCNESRIITKLLNMLLKMYSDHGLFDMGLSVFEYMIEKGVQRDEKTCTIHLLAMVQHEKVDLALDFLRRMATSELEVSVYSLTIVVSGLCNDGDLKIARELVEEMSGKGVKPNIITFNTLVDGCTRRWDFIELDLVLNLMERERIPFNDTTFKLLIDGYSGFSKVERAEKLLFEMHEKGFKVESYLYYTIIRGYCCLGNITRVKFLLKEMHGRQISPIIDIYLCLINCLCSIGEMGMVKELVDEMQSKGIELDAVMLNVLANGYCKAEMVVELAEIQLMIDKRHSSMIALDSNSELKLTMDGEPVLITTQDS